MKKDSDGKARVILKRYFWYEDIVEGELKTTITDFSKIVFVGKNIFKYLRPRKD